MSETVLVALVGAASAIIGAIVAAYVTIKRLPVETRRADAEASHVVVDVAADALEMIKKAANERTEALAATVESLKAELVSAQGSIKTLQRQAETDNGMIVMLNRKLGEMMRTAEAQSKEITRLQTLTNELQSHIAELVFIIKQAGLTLPDWAMAATSRAGGR